MNAESRIAALEAQLVHIARLLQEACNRLEGHNEDIGALADAVNRLERPPEAHSGPNVSPQGGGQGTQSTQVHS